MTEIFKEYILNKDALLFVAGVIVGFLFGLAIYWLPLKQLTNEIKSLFSLVTRRYRRFDLITVRAGSDLKAIDQAVPVLALGSDTRMTIAYDVGVEWYFCSSKGWVRSRVVHASVTSSQLTAPPLYKVSHFYIK